MNENMEIEISIDGQTVVDGPVFMHLLRLALNSGNGRLIPPDGAQITMIAKANGQTLTDSFTYEDPTE